MRFGPTDVGFIADSYRAYDELRRSAPLVYNEATDHWPMHRPWAGSSAQKRGDA